MRKPVLSVIILLLLCHVARPQGCVAIRNLAGFGQFAQLGYGQSDDKWMMNINFRSFKAYDDFTGTQHTPDPANSHITNRNRVTNFSLSRILENGWQISLDVPIAAGSITDWQDHAGSSPANPVQHTTSAFGIGDIRFTVYKWIWKNDVPRKGNLQVGVGLKFPTGNYHAQDYYYDSASNPNARALGPVNVAIQLGDGGTGITTELNGYYVFNSLVSIYGNFFYLISPTNTSAVINTPPNEPASPAQVQATYNVNSVPDNYTTRAGASFTFSKLVANAGLRYEGAPAHDLIGRNDGLRRVGHILSVEPGLQYKLRKGFLYCFVTLPVARATIQTVPDERYTQLYDPHEFNNPGVPHLAGEKYITQGHFAKSLLFVGYAFTF